MSERLIVIGGGGAGTAAATIAKRLNPDMTVTLFTEFPDIAYSPCGIPFVHGREIDKFESLFLSTVERYVEDGLDMRMETTVTDIDLDRRTVTARNTHEGFDKLILCTGFVWEKPGVPGDNLPGLHYVKDIRAAMEFDKELDDMKRVAVDRRRPARRRDGRRPRPPRPPGRLHRRGPVGALRGARRRRRRAGPRVAREARRDAAAGHARRGLHRHRPRARRCRPPPASSPATPWSSACTSCRARISVRPPGSNSARPAGSRSTSGCGRRRTACGRRATSSRSRTGSR